MRNDLSAQRRPPAGLNLRPLRLHLTVRWINPLSRHHHRQRARAATSVALGGDGQVTLGNIVVKATRPQGAQAAPRPVLAGFAGATADAFTLFERFEAKLEKHQGHLLRAAIELTKDWRTDRVLRRLEAMLAVADKETSLIITGNGDVLEPEHGIVAIGSGGAYAQAAARALLEHTELAAPRRSSSKSLEIAGDLCIYTNQHHTIEMLEKPPRRCAARAHHVCQHDPAGDRLRTRPPHRRPGNAKRAVAIALRNRWRRQQVDEKLRGEITPKNILMIGPTGVGKTEIARRLARLADAPFIKVEATKFTEVGYVGKDVDAIVRDLVDMAVKQERERADAAPSARRAEDAAEDRILDILVPPPRAEFGLDAAQPHGRRQHRAPGDAQAPARRRAGRQGDRGRARRARSRRSRSWARRAWRRWPSS